MSMREPRESRATDVGRPRRRAAVGCLRAAGFPRIWGLPPQSPSMRRCTRTPFGVPFGCDPCQCQGWVLSTEAFLSNLHGLCQSRLSLLWEVWVCLEWDWLGAERLVMERVADQFIVWLQSITHRESPLRGADMGRNLTNASMPQTHTWFRHVCLEFHNVWSLTRVVTAA